MTARTPALALLILFLAHGAAFSQRPQVLSVTPEKAGDKLGLCGGLGDLFVPKIVGTIKSGLPAVLRFDMRVAEESGRELLRADQSWKILYDLWTEKYRLRTAAEEKIFDDFPALEAFCVDFHSGPLLPLAHLQHEKKYRLRLQVTVIPISSKQKERWRDVLEAADNGQESNPAESRRNTFSVNVSQLLSFFISSKSQGASEWGESSWFRVAELLR